MNSTTPLYENYTSTSSDENITTNPFFDGSVIIFIILLLCVITFIFIVKSRKKFLFPK